MPAPRMDEARTRTAGRHVVPTVLVLLVVLGAALRSRGLGVSLWLDEAWVANSVLADSLSGMFAYEHWLQTTPPIFLVLARWGTAVFGTTNGALRLVPWLFGVAALGGFCLLARRVLSPWIAVLATALFAFSPPAIDYSRELKQYAAELFCATLLLALAWAGWTRDRPLRPWFVLPAVCVAPLLAYGSVFLLPALVASQLRRFTKPGGSTPPEGGDIGWERSVAGRGLAMLAAACVSGSILLFIVQRNSSPLLGGFWWPPDAVEHGPWLLAQSVRLTFLLSQLPGVGGLLGHPVGWIVPPILFGSILAAGFLMVIFASPERRREACVVAGVCGGPIGAMFAADLLHIYPWLDRTCLILLPALVLLIAHALDTLCGRGRRDGSPSVQFLAAVLAVPLVTWLVAAGVEREMRRPVAAKEDVQAAVDDLATSVGAGDLVYVDASMREGFRLYSRLRGWEPAGLLLGESGWPCCPRNLTRKESPGEILDRRDLARRIAAGFHGRVWVLVTGRGGHIAYLGLDIRAVIQRDLESLGCAPPVERTFEAAQVFVYNC